MTDVEVLQSRALARCRFSPGSTAKRFVAWAAGVLPEEDITPKASAFLNKLAHQYRKQLGKCMAVACETCGAPVVAVKTPVCAYCEKVMRLAPKYVRDRGRALTADGAKPLYGHEGNNLVCSSRCGFLVAIALVRAEPNVLSLLPAGWNDRHRRSV